MGQTCKKSLPYHLLSFSAHDVEELNRRSPWRWERKWKVFSVIALTSYSWFRDKLFMIQGHWQIHTVETCSKSNSKYIQNVAYIQCKKSALFDILWKQRERESARERERERERKREREREKERERERFIKRRGKRGIIYYYLYIIKKCNKTDSLLINFLKC